MYDPNNTSNGGRLQTASQGSTSELSHFLNAQNFSKRFIDVMGDKRYAKFKSTLLQVVSKSRELQQCSPMSVLSAAMQAANSNLDISPNFGYAAIIPFNLKGKGYTAQFQVMKKGWIQLALRSGQFSCINSGPVYEDELKGFDLKGGDIQLEYVPGGYRSQGRKDHIVGFFAYFRLINGMEKSTYWDLRTIEAHARTYSRSYSNYRRLPIEDGWKPDLYSTGIGWANGWSAMADKTVLKSLLMNYAPLSIEMEEAIERDQASFEAPDAAPTYVDNEIDAEDIGELPDEGQGAVAQTTDDVPEADF